MGPDRSHSASVGSPGDDGGKRFSWAEQLDERLNLHGSVVLSSRQLRTLFASIDPEDEEVAMDDLDAAAAADSDGTSLSGSGRGDGCDDDDDGEAGPAAGLGRGGTPESRDECESESGPTDASRVCLDGVFADLQRFKAERGDLTMSTSHPLFISIADELTDIGMEELLKKRYSDQLRSLRDFAEEHGHCRVPVEHPALGKWTRAQRRHYDRFKKRLPGPLTEKRFAKLVRISGFDVFDPSNEEGEVGAVAARASDGGAAPPGDGLALDEKIRRKKARKVELTAGGGKDLSSSKKLPGREAVAAEMRKKRALLRKQRSEPQDVGGKDEEVGLNGQEAEPSSEDSICEPEKEEPEDRMLGTTRGPADIAHRINDNRRQSGVDGLAQGPLEDGGAARVAGDAGQQRHRLELGGELALAGGNEAAQGRTLLEDRGGLGRRGSLGLEDIFGLSDASNSLADEKYANECSEDSDLALALQLAAEENGANERGKGSDPVVAHNKELEKLRRSVQSELDAAANSYREKMGDAGQHSHSFSVPRGSMGIAGKDRPEKEASSVAFTSKAGPRRRATTTAAPTGPSRRRTTGTRDRPGAGAIVKTTGGGPSGQSSPAGAADDATEGHGSSYGTWLDLMRNADANAMASVRAKESKPRRRRPKGGSLRNLSTTTGATGGHASDKQLRTFDERLQRKLDRGQSMPVISADGAAGDRSGKEGGARRRSKGGHLLSASTTSGARRSSTFEERLQRKLEGESLGDIYQDPSYREMCR